MQEAIKLAEAASDDEVGEHRMLRLVFPVISRRVSDFCFLFKYVCNALFYVFKMYFMKLMFYDCLWRCYVYYCNLVSVCAPSITTSIFMQFMYAYSSVYNLDLTAREVASSKGLECNLGILLRRFMAFVLWCGLGQRQVVCTLADGTTCPASAVLSTPALGQETCGSATSNCSRGHDQSCFCFTTYQSVLLDFLLIQRDFETNLIEAAHSGIFQLQASCMTLWQKWCWKGLECSNLEDH